MLQEWDEAAQSEETMTLEEMDKLVQDLHGAKTLAEEAQKRADEVKAEYQAKREHLLAALKANNRSKYEVDGVATVYISSKEVYRVPKTNEDKNKLFEYISNKYGEEALTSMTSIHSATLTSWANQESEQGVMSIPGLEAPTMMETLNMRRK